METSIVKCAIVRVPLLLLLTVAMTGCSTGLDTALALLSTVDLPTDADSTSDETPLTETGEVRVSFENYSPTSAVDVEFHTTSAPLGDPGQDLFVAEYLLRSGIGIAGTGIIEPLHQDSITLPCSTPLTLGTLGGRFMDQDTGELLGTGVARWVSEEQLGLCGRVVTIQFREDDGAFVTLVQLD